MSDTIATKIAELEATLRMPGLPAAAREAVEQQLRALQGQVAQLQSGGANLGVGNTIGQIGDIAARDQTRGTVDNQGRIDGVAVGVNLGTIIYGRVPEDDERRRLVWYLDSLANKLYRLPLRGIEQRLDQGNGMSLPHVYVMLATTDQLLVMSGGFNEVDEYCDIVRVGVQGTTDPAETAPLVRVKASYRRDLALPDLAISELQLGRGGGKEPIQLFRQRLAIEAVQQHSHLVLLGDPGGGKSTFVRHLAWALAWRGLDQGSQAPALFGWPDDARTLPLILSMRALASRIAADGSQPAVVAAALSAELATSYNVRQAEALVEQALHSGVALLLLDGLDEVPLEGTPRQRADRATVLRIVREFAQLYPHACVVLTCRTRAFDEGMRAELGWHVETIAPFTLGQIRHFVPSWYGELVAVGQIEPRQANQIGTKLIDAITDPRRARLRDGREPAAADDDGAGAL